jgi:hypothetical protein
LAQAYVKQRQQLGYPVDLQNYGTPEALEKAYSRDKARLDAKGKGQNAGENSGEVSVDELDDLQLMQEYQRQQMAINTALGQPGVMPGMIPGQVQTSQQMPGQFQQPMQQQIPGQVPQMQQQGFQQPGQMPGQVPQGYYPQQQPSKHSVLDNPNVNAEELAERLIADPAKTLREIIREEMNIQGAQLGGALQGVLTPVIQSQMQIRSSVEQDRELNKLDKQLRKSGESLDDYLPEIQQVLQQYPGLANVKDGYAQALGMARVTKAMNTRRPVTNTKAGLRVGASQGAGVPKGQYGQPRPKTREEMEHDKIFGTSVKPKKLFDD